MNTETRAGHVALIGLPNTGKSSLLNRFIGTRLSIVTPFAQTTRERVVGIDTDRHSQLIFLDTPGIVEPSYLLHHSMAGVVEAALDDADVVVLLLDGTSQAPELAPAVLDRLRSFGSRLVVAINKLDLASPARVQELTGWVRGQLEGADPVSVSAETGEGIETLRAEIVARLPVSPFFYPDDELSTLSVRFFVAEMIREAAFGLYQDEVPYSIAVKVDEFREDRDPMLIRATIYIERGSQKAIIIGAGGSAIRKLGIQARQRIEAFLERRVYLDLWVKVLPRWRKDPLELQRLGFKLPLEG